MRASARFRTSRAGAGSLLAGSVLAFVLAHPLGAQSITPEALPTSAIDGFSFPESEAALTAQITTMTRSPSADERAAAAAHVDEHGWGLWTALTWASPQRYEGQALRVYETWPSIDELAATSGPAPLAASSPPAPRTTARPMRAISPQRLNRLQIDDHENPPADDAGSGFDPIIGTIKFDPTAANHIRQQQLLRASALDALLTAGAPQTPAFPMTAVSVKPTYRVASARDLVAGRYFLLKVWSGPPATPQPWGPDQWTAGVWIDLRGGGSGSGAVDTILAADGSSRTAANTYPIDTFIHHPLSATDAAALNQAVPGTNALTGDTALLVAMHVATREITRWTWQTFWWTQTPDQPPVPSSADIAAVRPSQLQGAPRHYAMALAYTMLSPEQPYTGGSNTSPAVYAYNPWIEAHFGPADLPDSRPGFGPDGQPAGNNYGVQTNCMSCHAQATYHGATLAIVPRFTGARYVDLIDPAFVGTLQTDFVWALSRHAQ